MTVYTEETRDWTAPLMANHCWTCFALNTDITSLSLWSAHTGVVPFDKTEPLDLYEEPLPLLIPLKDKRPCKYRLFRWFDNRKCKVEI